MKILLLSCFVMTYSVAFTQEPIKLNIVYQFTYIRDLENKAIPYQENMVLSLGKNSSRYCSQTLFNENDKKSIEAQKKQQERMSNMPSGTMVSVVGGPMLTVGKYGAVLKEEITKQFAQKKMDIDTKVALRSYSVETALPEIKWMVSNETKKIGGYDCQKALSNYGGRQYEAWFTTQLTYRDGPWKLCGLPGLILEAKDTANEVSFVFKEISKNEDVEETTQSFLHSQYSVNTNLKDLEKAKMAFEIDPEGVMSAQAPNARLMVKNIDDAKDKTVVKIKRYNPMER